MFIKLGLTAFLFIFLAAAYSVFGMGFEAGLYYSLLSIISAFLLGAIFLGGFSWFYLFLVIFFVLGVWLKVSVHHIFDYDYIEPVGNFQGSYDDWIAYYKMACIMAIAIFSSRFFCLLIFKGRVSKVIARNFEKNVVSGYEWVLLLLGSGIFYFLNNQFAFFVTGVSPNVALPFGLNAPLSFMALLGVPMLVAMYVAKDVRARGFLDARVAVTVLLISFFASISMASRAAIVMQVVPILVAATYVQHCLGFRKLSLKPVFLFFVFLLAVLSAVSLYRIGLFSHGDGLGSATISSYVYESAFLFIDRWIGAEAIMVASSETSASPSLFYSIFMESPGVGVDAIYQVLSESKYNFIEGFTFLTLPGYFGVFGLSGSLPIIFLLTFFMVFLGAGLERFLMWNFYYQDIPIALVGAAMANSLTQMSFPWLVFPFFLQMLLFSLILRFIFDRKWFNLN
jgi:hypothetical protein